MSVRETILGNLATGLATITTANAYSMNVDTPVLRDMPHSDNLNQEITKARVVIEDAGADSLISWFSSNKALVEFDVVIRCYVQSARSEEPNDEIGNIQADVMKLLDSPVSLGSNARYAYWKNNNPVMLAERVAAIDMTVGIVYWYTRTAP